LVEPPIDRGAGGYGETIRLGCSMVVAVVVAGEACAQESKPDAAMSWFVTSVGVGEGGNLGGLAGAHCQEPRASVDNVATADQIVWNSISQPRLYTVLMVSFAVLAVALAAIGIFGLMAYLVEQRTREIGIRMALGARRSEVMSNVLGQSAVLILAGEACGIAAAAGLTRYLVGMLFGLTSLDPVVFGAAAMLFVVVALGASYLPARRATRIDPLVALRAE
jgi:predicted lysophospholipase L1 biosynthesis ABC-type transport system permease subunit